MKKVLSILLCLCMLSQNLPMVAFAAYDDNLCDHHLEHTAECGYREGSAGSACTHEHSEGCYGIVDCSHTHGDCGYSEGTAEVPCGHVHDESCGYVQALVGTPCANAETDPECDHTGDCGYAAAVEGHPCRHTACDDACGYAPATEGTPCTHVCEVKVGSADSCYKLLCSHKDGSHDSSCGYVQAVEAHDCHYECAECAAAPESEEPSEESSEPAPVCNCGTDDPDIHATTCAVYVAPENPQCFCAEKCTEVNEWCDICGFDHTACTGTDAAVVYSSYQLVSGEADQVIAIIVSTSGDDKGIKYRILVPANSGIGRVEVCGYNDDLITVIIPSTITLDDKTYNVTGIAGEALKNCSSLTSISIPASVTSIGNGAFKGTGIECTTHRFTETACDICDFICSHKKYEEGKCTVCGMECDHSFYPWTGECTKCKKFMAALVEIVNVNETYYTHDQVVSGKVFLNGGTIRLCDDIFLKEDAYLTISNGTLDLNGFSLTAASGYAVFTTGNLTICNNSEREGSINNRAAICAVKAVGDAFRVTVKDNVFLANGSVIDNGIHSFVFENTGSGILDLTGWENVATGTFYIKNATNNLGSSILLPKGYVLMYNSTTVYPGFSVPASARITVAACTEHSGGTATCTTQAVCETCGANYGALKPDYHTSEEFAYTANEDGTTHTKVHKCCGAIAGGYELHIFHSTTGKCSGCEANMAAASTTVDGTITYHETVNEAIGKVRSCTAEDGAEVMLLKDHSKNISIFDGVFTLNLNGNTVRVEDNQGNAMDVSGGTVTVTGGTLSGTRKSVIVHGGTLNITDGTVIATTLNHDATKSVDVRGGILNVSGGTITGPVKGVYVQENGTVNITGGTIRTEGSKKSGSVYLDNGTVNISGGTFYDDNALRVDGGNAYVTGGTFHGENNDIYCSETGSVQLSLPANGTSGAAFPEGLTATGSLSTYLGEGVGYWLGGKQVALTEGQTEITGGDVTVKAACDHSGSGHTTANDNGNGKHSFTCTVCQTTVTEDHNGGTATCTTQAICDTCGASYGELGAHTPGATGKCTMEGCGYQYPAKVGDTFYETVHKALRAAEGINGCTLILLDNITLTSMSSTTSYVNMGAFTLDLNGKTLSSNKGTLSVLGSANLTIKDSVGGGKIVSTGSNAIDQSGGKVTIEGGTFEGTLDGVFLSGGSTLIVKGGTFIGSRAMITGFGSNVKIDLTDIAPTGFTLKNNGSGTFAPNLPSGYAMVNGSGEVVNSLSAEESATVKASLENATVTLDKTTFTYDGQPHKPGVTVTLSGRKLTEGTDYRVFYSGARKMQDGKPSQWFGDYTTSADCINAGEDYYAVVIGLGNYYTKDAFTLYENFVIKPKEVTELTFVGLNEVYAHTGEAIEPTFTVKDGETEIPTSEYTVAYSNNSEVGTATITITDNKGGNYTVSGSKTFQIVVHIHVWNYSASGNTITATCSGDIGTCPDPEQSITLTVPEDHTYTGDATYSASVEGSIDGVTCSVLYTGANTGYSSSEAPVNADTYTVTLTAGGESVSDTFTISRKIIANCTASLNEDQFAYSGKAPELGVTVVDGSVGNSTLTKDTDYTVGDVQSNAGIYKLTVTGIGNYTGTLELDYTITAKEVSIIGAEIKAVTYDPAGYTLNVIGVTFGGVVEGENLAYTATAELTGTNAVGERDATVTVTLNNSNYTLKTATYKATVTINKAVATVTAAPTAKALTYTGEAKDLINGGSANGGEMQYSTDNETWSTTIPQGTDAGEYTVYYKVVADANHSDTEPGNIKVKIDKALLTVTAKDNTIAYGEVPSGNGVEYRGFANGETEAMLGGTVAYTYNYQRYGNVGSYKITPAGLTSGNYDITFADGILTVVAKTITVTAEGKSKTYGEADPELTYKVEGLVNGDELTGALSRETGENVDTYSIVQGNLAAGSNYAITFTGADFTISKRSVTITAKDQTIFYGTEISNTEIAANGLVDGHSVTATLTPSTTMLTENGTITASNAVIKANGADVTANYEISYEDGKLVIAFDTSVIDALEPETVKSDDQSNLEEILDTIDGLLEEEGLTEEQKKTLEDSKTKAEELLDVIESARDDLNTENTEKVEDVTADNVRPEEKEALENAKADLEKALTDNSGNYTDEEKKDIRDEIQRIADAIGALENAKAVEEAIKDLPETVEPDDEDDVTDIEAAKKAYEELTTHEKSLIDKELREKLEALLDDAYDYDIIKGDGGKWTKGSSSGLSVTANGPFSKFVGIEVDDKEVDEQYYEAKSGSTIITLKKSFLKKLSTGKHTITVLYTDGETSGTFKIRSESDIPATGDDFNIMLSSSVCVVSFMALAALFLKSRKHKQTK